MAGPPSSILARIRPGPRRPAASLPATVCGWLLLGPGCTSPGEAVLEADREVVRLVEERREALFGEAAEPFALPPAPERGAALSAELEAGPLSLVDCLLLAAEHSRLYQGERERLYLAALDLTLERWRFSLQESAVITGSVFGRGDEAVAEGRADVTLSKLLGSGTQVLAGLGESLFRSLATTDPWTAVSTVGVAFTQPLLRGSGRLVVEEPLTQAEHDLVYEVRSFERFRRELAVEVAQRFYRLLQQGNLVENEMANRRSLALLREKNEALAEAGRLSEIQVDQARQDELRSLDRLLEARRSYEAQADSLKLLLGLPPALELVLDENELVELTREGLPDLGFEPGRVVALALAERLDLLNARGRWEDAQRRVLVAEDALRAGLDVSGALEWDSQARQPLEFDFRDADWSLSVALDLPLDRLPQRNVFRASILAAEAARRELVELTDGIVADLRDFLRTLETSRETYEIQLGAVRLAERRVESVRLSLDAGRAETRDLLEAQDSLLEAQNALTRALIDYTIAKLFLLRDVEVLRVGPAGLVADETLLAPPVEVGA